MSELADGLEKRGYLPVFDRADRPHIDPDLRLSAQDEWWEALKTMIAASDVMVFIVTPDSAASHVCDDEVAYAKGLGKRVIAILRRDIDFMTAPERLRALNVKLDFRSDDPADMATAMEALTVELDLDIEWHRQGNRLMRAADQWNKDGRPEGQLLRSSSVVAADAWAARRPHAIDFDAPLLLDFLEASRTYEAAQRDRQRRVVGRAFVKPATQALEEGQIEHALRLAATGSFLAQDLDTELVPELWPLIVQATCRTRTVLILGHHGHGVQACYSPDGKSILTVGEDNAVRVWDEAGRELLMLPHNTSTSAAGFSPDGRRIVAFSIQGEAFVWDATNGQIISQLNIRYNSVAAKGIVQPSCFNADGSRIVLGGAIFDVESGAVVAQLVGHEAEIRDSLFSPDGNVVATSSDDRTVRMWRCSETSRDAWSTVATLATFSHGVGTLLFGSDSCTLLAIRRDKSASIWSRSNSAADDWEEVSRLKGFLNDIREVSFSADGNRLITIADTMRVWIRRQDNHRGWDEVATIADRKETVWSAEFSRDGRQIAASEVRGASAIVMDSVTGEEIIRFEGLNSLEGAVAHLSFDREGKRLLASGGRVRILDLAIRNQIGRTELPDSRGLTSLISSGVRLLENRSGELVIRTLTDRGSAELFENRSALQEPPASLTAAAFSEDGRWLAATSHEGASVWDISRGALKCTLVGAGSTLTSADFSNDGERFVALSSDTAASLWDLETGARIGILDGHRTELKTVKISPNGRLIVTISAWDDAVFVWDGSSGKKLRELKHGSTHIHDACFSPDGRYLATAANNEWIAVWDCTGEDPEEWRTTTQMLVKGTPVGIKFSPDSTKLLVLRDRLGAAAAVWDALTGELVAEFQQLSGWVDAAVFSADGMRVATASEGLIRVWCARTALELLSIKHEAAYLAKLKFSADGLRLFAILADTLCVWDVSRSAALVGDRAAVIASAIADGVGLRSALEGSDLLMQDAPEDLFVAVSSVLTPLQLEDAAMKRRLLHEPLHLSCYASAQDIADIAAASAGAGKKESKQEILKRELLARRLSKAGLEFGTGLRPDAKVSGSFEDKAANAALSPVPLVEAKADDASTHDYWAGGPGGSVNFAKRRAPRGWWPFGNRMNR